MGLPTSYLTEHLRVGDHKETIQFVVALKMAEAIILELFWLAKWIPRILWGKNAKCMVK